MEEGSHWMMALGALFMFVILPFGLSHMFLSEKDRAELASKSDGYRAWIQLCRTLTILVHVGIIVLLVAQCISSGGSGPDCEYGRTGARCGY